MVVSRACGVAEGWGHSEENEEMLVKAYTVPIRR